ILETPITLTTSPLRKISPARVPFAFIKRSAVLCALILLGTTQPGSSPEGRWLTEKKNGVVQIFRCSGGDVLCGRLVWFRLKPGDSNLDLSNSRSEEHTSELQSLAYLVCRLLLEKKKPTRNA